jgi:replication factor C subunit 1
MMSHRSSAPLHPGVLKVPDGLPNCLAGFSFVFTGEFSELGREEIADLAKRYGGKVVSAPSKRTSFVVVGANPGPGKIEKIKGYNLKALSEEQFYKLIENQPAKTEEGHVFPEQPLVPLNFKPTTPEALSKPLNPFIIEEKDARDST